VSCRVEDQVGTVKETGFRTTKKQVGKYCTILPFAGGGLRGEGENQDAHIPKTKRGGEKDIRVRDWAKPSTLPRPRAEKRAENSSI